MSTRPSARPAPRLTALAAAIAATASPLFSPTPAPAINITMNYNNGASIEPAADSTGALLTALMNYVDSYYTDIFQDAHNLTINFWWDNAANFSNPTGTLAVHSLVSQGGNPNRETAANIRFNNSFSWFIDSTPANDSEFNMVQTLWRDLTATQRSNDFNFSGTIPATFEVGYTGNAIAGGGATGATDLLSVAFHEVGHALGMSAANNATVAQTADNDYDFNPLFVFGATLAAETATSTDEAHLDAQFGLMQPSIGQGIRRRPSHTDLFSMASGHQYTNLDIPRREFYGGGNWNAAANWSGNAVPGSADIAYVRNPGSPVSMGLTANGFAGTLFVLEGAQINTNAFKLDVSGATTIDAAPARIRIAAGGEFETASLTVTNSGSLVPVGGLADILGDATIDGGNIIGFGTVQVAGTLLNNGVITATDGNTLTITAVGGGSLNLDGSSGLFTEPGLLRANNGNLVFNGAISDAFNSTMTIAADRSITFNTPWTLAAGSIFPFVLPRGTLDLNGGAAVADAATLAGSTATLSGNVDASGFAVISAPVIFASPTVTVASGATLRLSNATTYNGGSYTGAGTLQQNGNATVTGDTTIAVATLDWDGTSGNTVTTVSSGATLTINSNVIDLSGGSFGGTVTLNGGALAVNTAAPWTLASDGVINLNVGGGFPSVSGSEIIVFGAIDANGNSSTIAAPVDFRSSAAVTVTAVNDMLALQGATIYRGGSYTGAGTIRQHGHATIAANTTIAVGIFDWDGGTFGAGATTVNPGVTLTINSPVIDQSGGAYDGTITVNSGILNVNTVAAWALDPAGRLNFNNTGGGTPTLNGSPFLANGHITATGPANTINPATTFSASTDLRVPAAADLLTLAGPTTYAGGAYTGAGTLRQNGAATVTANTTVAVATFDLDGLSEAFGSLTVNSGVNLIINSTRIDAPGDGFDGTATLQGGILTVNTAAQWALEGTLNMNKPGVPTPTLAGSAEVLHTGTINAANGGTIASAYRFGVTPTVNVAASTLLMSNTFSSNAGATLTKTGAGTLRVAGAQTHAAGATINVNAGTLLMETNADPAGVATNLRVTVNPTGIATFNASQRLDSLIIANNASASLNATGNRYLYTTTLSITGTGFLQLNDNDAIIDYAGATPFPTILGYVTSGYNAGNWNGAGIRSNNASLQPDHLTALAIAENSLLGFPSFDGQIVDNTSILIKYTYYGDANFNGRIDADDFALIDKGRALGLSGWVFGDFNYSGSVNAADYILIDKSFLLQSGTLAPDASSHLAMREAQFGPDYVAQLLVSIPEPSLAAPFLAGLPLLRRRR